MSSGSSTDSYPAFAHIGSWENSGINLNQFKVCHGSLYAVMWLADEPREFNLPTLPQRCQRSCLESTAFILKSSLLTDTYGNADNGRNVNCFETCIERLFSKKMCFQQVTSMEEVSPRQILNYHPVGKRSLGRPFKRQQETVTGH
ncbi:hypothetical protein ANN_03557 [Periplaneta americana]|uniref:Uncharacterized protein n=1 Tax=Periplaneta americana TaxID=6978 RepID=A0ABQ8U2X7_PERAM|nr:hypothetical protein ANN_03557 [Periplaneta americana]